MKATETYLRRATRGLWGRKRREVREELEAHLSDRVTAYRIGGLGEAEAAERALAELGSPQEVSMGMTRLYTLPTVMGSGAALVAACVLVVAVLPRGVAQALPGTFFWPSAKCVEALESGTGQPSPNNCFSADNSLWIDRQALQRALEPQGVKFSKASGSNTEELLGLTFPNSTPIYVSLGRNNVFVTDEAGRDIAPAPGYLSLWNLLQAASYQKNLLIEVEGWDDPTVRFNDVSFRIGTDTRPMNGTEFYENYLDAVLFKDLINPVSGDYVYNVNPRLNRARNSALQNTSIALPDGAPGVYGIITRLDLDEPFPAPVYPGEVPWDVSFMLSVARSDDEAMVNFELPKAPLHFVDAFSVEQPQGTSILVKLSGGADTGEGWYEIISPETITLKPTS